MMYPSLSLSARRAWIEITTSAHFFAPNPQSLSARRAWIEISGHAIGVYGTFSSLSARRAWIEISIIWGLRAK